MWLGTYVILLWMVSGDKKRCDFIEVNGNSKRFVGRALGFVKVHNLGVLGIMHPLDVHPESSFGKEPIWKVFHGQCLGPTCYLAALRNAIS